MGWLSHLIQQRIWTGLAGCLAGLLVTNGVLARPAGWQHASDSPPLVVTSITDDDDAAPGNGVCVTAAGMCSLRAAIQEANWRPGSDLITFALSGNGVNTIQLTRQLPTLSDQTGPTTIDGYTQPGAAPNSDPLVSNAVILVQVAGAGPEHFDGLSITSANNMIRGLAIFKVRHAIVISGSGAHDNLIGGNFIGTDAYASYVAPFELFANGVEIRQGATRNRIGAAGLAERNVISGNAFCGIALFDSGTIDNQILNNLIGLGPRGDTHVPNARHGVDINNGASRNVIGGYKPGERNVISGNGWSGVEISHGRETQDNLIIGNLIGTDVSGKRAMFYSANFSTGVQIEDGASNNVVAGNVIGNSHGGGVSIEGSATRGNQVLNNRIGISLDGSLISNRLFGIQIRMAATETQIGPGNMIAYNPIGVRVAGEQTDFNTITRNAIFANTIAGIDIDPPGENANAQIADDDANQAVPAPRLISAMPAMIIGSTCVTCTVELFLSNGNADIGGQGQLFLGVVVADSDGHFAMPLPGIALNSFVVMTTTDAAGNSSEFTPDYQVGAHLYLPLVAAATGG